MNQVEYLNKLNLDKGYNFKDISDVFNADVVSDSFEEDDDLIETKIATLIRINFVKQFDEILNTEYKTICHYLKVDLLQRC